MPLLLSLLLLFSILKTSSSQPTPKVTPVEELCQWLMADCAVVNKKTIPTMDPRQPLDIAIYYIPTHLLAIDEIAQKFVQVINLFYQVFANFIYFLK